ncbi:MAG: alpha/beta hydrolase [Clostridia bacterium]|nr:alpha/beta hydrolase [Clostridia bacterium]
MKFQVFGNPDKPAVIMLPGSFCPASAMAYLYEELLEEACIIAPDYNGHYEGSPDFTTRQQEAGEILNFLQENGISHAALIYGQSMGAEVGMELLSQMQRQGLTFGSAFFDGAPMISLSKPYRALMRLKFSVMLRLIRSGSIEKVLKLGFVKRFTNGDTACLRDTLMQMEPVARCVTKQTVRNETECCYTFDFPPMTEADQRRVHFLYAEGEKAHTSCFRHVKAAYPAAEYQVISGYGHLTYSLRETDAYLNLLRTYLKA